MARGARAWGCRTVQLLMVLRFLLSVSFSLVLVPWAETGSSMVDGSFLEADSFALGAPTTARRELATANATAVNSSRTLLEDGEVLLLFKAAITSDPNNALKFWKRQGKRQVLNACRWVGVQCTKRRVTAVDLYNQSLQGAIDPSLGRLSNLISLDLSNNFLFGSLPAEFGTLKSLTSLNVYNNNLSGSIPASLGSLPALKTLNLSRNNFGGSIPPELGNDTALETLDLSGNDLVGALQMEFSQLRNLSLFNASSNRLSKGLPTTIGDLASLVSLDLSNNELGGPIPPTIGDLLQLQTLALADSLLIGTIPQDISNCVKLKDFRLNNNQLRGVVPVQLTGIQTLLILQLQNNSLEGSFVSTLGSFRNLEELDLSYNNLNGSVPAALGSLPLRSNLSLAHNSLTGPIPPELGGLGLVQSIDLSSNNLSGDIPQSLSGCVNLTKLDLSGNSLNGSIPKTLNSLSGLSLLNVSHNDLTGFLPSFGNMSNLKVLDASSNQLSGEIMSNCVNFATLSALNLSYNDFEGQVPPFRPHDGVTERSFLGNPNLCGDILNRSCRNRRNGLSIAVIIGIVCGLAAGALIALLILCCCCCKRIKGKRKSGKHSATVSAELQLKLTPEEILAATGGFNQANFLGAGSVSTVYRGVLRDETVVAVKRLAVTTGDGKPECEILLDIEMETLGHIRHKTLVKVLGYCSSSEIKALVLEYMHNGNLDTLLYPPPHAEVVRLFDWYLRFDAAIGVAKGLKYLHHDCAHPIIHGDVKPSNILFDGRMEARISDFGVARILADQGLGQKVGPSASSSTAYGYTAPEIAASGVPTTKGDVYSFGVVLLEMLSRRKPFSLDSDQTLPQWIRTTLLHSKALQNVLDPVLMVDISHHQQKINMVLGVALLCTRENPQERPVMEDVLKMLLHIRTKTEGGSRRSLSRRDSRTMRSSSGKPQVQPLPLPQPLPHTPSLSDWTPMSSMNV